MLAVAHAHAVNCIMKLLRRMSRQRLKWLAVTAAAQERFNEELQARLRSSVWLSGGCGSWYVNKDGEGSSGGPFFFIA